MARSARLFLCSRCHDQVLLCSHGDRGQQYCSRECYSLSRCERRREAAERYQSSRRGQFNHTDRTARSRQRRRSRGQPGSIDDVDKVTHQGCSDAGTGALLLACDTPSACEASIDIGSVSNTGSVNSLGSKWCVTRSWWRLPRACTLTGMVLPRTMHQAGNIHPAQLGQTPKPVRWRVALLLICSSSRRISE